MEKPERASASAGRLARVDDSDSSLVGECAVPTRDASRMRRALGLVGEF